MKIRISHLPIVLIFLGVTGFAPQHQSDITSEEIMSHIKVLASDKLEGREAGTPGGRKAARYIVRQFRYFGLTPLGKHHSFKIPFTFTSGVKLGRHNQMVWESEDEIHQLRVNVDFRPLEFSASGRGSGQLVFVGYGIEADELNYHDYAGVEASGRVVMILRYSPDGTNPHGEFGKYAPLRYKTMTAREKGAIAVVFVTGPEDDPDEDYLMKLRYDQSFSDSGIPVVVITQRRANEMISFVDKTLSPLQKEINTTRSPHSFELPIQVSLNTSLRKVTARTENVVGMVEGRDNQFRDEYIVIGAHYDHLGWGGEGSLVPDTVAIHNGADDNASGIAGLLELAEWFSEHPLRRSIIFAAFGAEEWGLLGSTEFVNHPPIPLEKVTAMMNMDMIGRMKDSTMVAGGSGTSSKWKELVEQEAETYHLKPKFDEAGYGASDHQSFYLKNIPVLFFFSGMHDDYHRPSDDWEKINAPGEVRILELVREIVTDVAENDTVPDFVKVEGSEPTRGGFAVYLGTIPDYTATDVVGMKLSGVRAGGPAEKGGMKAGDIIVKFGEKTITNIYDFMYALQEAKADQPVTIVVLRGEEEVVLEVIPGRRRD